MRALVVSALLLAGCSNGAGLPDAFVHEDASEPREDAAEPDAGSPEDAAPFDSGSSTTAIQIQVLIDGSPSPNTLLVQGGGALRWITDAEGRAIVTLDPNVRGDPAVLASHPDARVKGALIDGPGPFTIELLRFGRGDNPAYPFTDPGEPSRRPNTAQCGHCHETLNDDWFASPHKQSASNPIVHDLYAGAAHSYASEPECTTNGGLWREGREPGTGAPAFRCYVGDGLLATLNPSCTTPPCEPAATELGNCADCHAPAIDGVIGGRGLLEARGIAYDYGVSCDVCHRVESVDDNGAAGIAGRLHLLRPSEPGPRSLGAGGFLPLTFGPSHDSPNPRMGSVQRDHFREARFCGGCHQLDEPVRVPGRVADPVRWPGGLLPMQSTYEEWRTGPMNPAAPCQSCHMPPEPLVANGADLQRNPTAAVGYQGGWYRAPGSVRRHTWYGPRQPASGMLELAASIFIQKQVAGGVLSANVRVKNTGAGHAIPTGEPMRALVLTVEARCGATPLVATGGDAVPDFGGALDTETAAQSWSLWAGAQPGDEIRVVRRTGAHHDYAGFGPFGDGRFSAAEKGMPVEDIAGHAIITSTTSTTTRFDRRLPSGDVAYRLRGPALAGTPGFGFARVLVGPNGERRVFGFRAVDVASDNRLLPQQSWTSRHVFAASCADPIVEARLYYRPYAFELARERGWPLNERLMVEARR